jgi:hypothetical protein
MANRLERSSVKQPIRLFSFLLAALLLSPAQVRGVACPSGGAKVDVCVYNPTGSTSPLITVSGSVINGEFSCTGPAPISGSYSSSFSVGAGQTYCPPGGLPTGGLLSGMYVHRIQVTGTTQNQYQQGMALVSTGARPRVDWTYFPNVITVNVAGAGGAGTCPVNAISSPATCDIRTAAFAAKNVSGTLPVLIQLTVSPGTIPSPVLRLERDNLTVDGADANGNPYIVGDANAAAAGSQDAIPRVLELWPGNAVWVQANGVTLKGLEIRHLLGMGEASINNLITQFAPFTGTRLEAVRLDARNTTDCTAITAPPQCDSPFSLIRLASRTTFPSGQSLTLVNVEGRSALYRGVDAQAKNDVLVQKSWLRNNYRGNVGAETSTVRLEQSVIERAGLRASDDRVVTAFSSHGVEITNPGSLDSLHLETDKTIVRNNREAGIYAFGLGDVVLQDDAICGNGANGLLTLPALSGFIPSLNSLGGVGATYNTGSGARVAQDDFTAAALNNDSVFASNTACGLFNSWPFDPVQARNNQWRGGPPPTPIPDTCSGVAGAGPVDIGTEKDENTEPIMINGTAPSNAILNGQTLRVLGQGFNGINGNPLANPGPSPTPSTCSAGVNTLGAGQGQSCCRRTGRANGCDGSNQPIDGGGNCVLLRSSAGQWFQLGVKAVTPRMLETQVPTGVFSCLGNSGEQVWVSKKVSGVPPIFDTGAYCTTTNPL